MYITPTQLLSYYDKNRILQLLLDDGTDATVTQLSDPTSDAYKLLVVLSNSVDAEIDSAVQVGARYSRSDLEQMIVEAAAPGANAVQIKRAALLNRLAADLLFGALITRRTFVAEEIERLCPRYAAAQQMLAQLGDGMRVFDLDGAISAGTPSPTQIGQKYQFINDHSRLFGIFPGNSNGLWGQ